MKLSLVRNVFIFLILLSLRLNGATALQEGFASEWLHLDLLMGFGALKAEFLQEGNTSYVMAQIELSEEYASTLGKDIQTLHSWHVDAYMKENELIVVAYNNELAATLFYDKKDARGFVDALGALISFKIEENRLSLDATIASLQETLHAIGVDIPALEASVVLHAMKELGSDSATYGEISIPHYSYKTNSEFYEESNNTARFSFQDNMLHLQNYNLGFKGGRYYSDKESIITIDEDSNILFKSLWIYDNLLLHGMYDSSEKALNMTLKSESFHFDQYDSNISLRADVSIKIDSEGSQEVDGEIELLDGFVGYMPKEAFEIDDEDIIILGEQKEEDTNSNRSINLHIYSQHPMLYKLKENEILFTPKLYVKQKNRERIFVDGNIEFSQSDLRFYDKDFRLLKSEILFDGKADNPSLFLTLNHTTEDDVNIEIFITKRVENPLILFSSSPSMSQNDILSYLLFGQSSAGAFDIQDEGGNSQNMIAPFLLATSLKKVLNDTTPLQIDKLNILTNETTGRYGYEVGAKVGRDFRVVYKNNEIATVIFQYRLTNALRFDVDLREAGQGASIIYMKDFDLHMPWHVEERSE